jgi:DNA-binding transcriptional LysR family regulator
MTTGVELREIRPFLMVAEELHFGRAAERLRISSGRVSQTIRTLELRLGGRLFDRTSRQVSLTPLGEGFRRSVADPFAALEQAFRQTRRAAIGVAGELRVGRFSRAMVGPHHAEIVRTFEDRHPDCRVALIEIEFGRDPAVALRREDVDLAAMRLPITETDIAVGPQLTSEERVLAVSADDPLAQRDQVSVEDLAGRAVVDFPALPRPGVDAFIPPRTPSGARLERVTVNSFGELMMRIALGEIVHPTVQGFFEGHRHPGVVAVAIRDLSPSQTALAWLASNRSPKVQAFARAAADVLASHAARVQATR